MHDILPIGTYVRIPSIENRVGKIVACKYVLDLYSIDLRPYGYARNHWYTRAEIVVITDVDDRDIGKVYRR